MWRIFFAVLLAMALMGTTVLAADTHAKATEKKVSDELSISAPVKIGGKMLPAGHYRIQCDGKEIIFQNAKGEKVAFPCHGKQLDAKASATEMHMNVENGERVVSSLLLRGSPIEHTF